MLLSVMLWTLLKNRAADMYQVVPAEWPVVQAAEWPTQLIQPMTLILQLVWADVNLIVNLSRHPD
jgi:hypothetical protein